MSSAPAVRPSRRPSTRLAGLGALLAVLAFALLAPGATLANDLHQSPPIRWDARGFGDECKDVDLEAGQVLWHFVQTQTDAASGTLSVTFQTKGTFTVESYKHSGGVLHWNVITGADVLLDA